MNRRRLYAAAIGESNTDYYLEQFEKFDQEGKTSISTNRGAAIGVGVWLFWRRLWLHGLAYIALGALILFGLINFLISYIDTVESFGRSENQAIASIRFILITGLHLFSALFVLGYWTIPVFLIVGWLGSLPSLYGNAWYYRKCNRRIDDALKKFRTEDAAAKALSRGSGTSFVGAIFSVALLVSMVVLAFSTQASTQKASEDKKWAHWIHKRSQTHAQLKNHGNTLYARLKRWSPDSRKIPLVITEADAVAMPLYFNPENPEMANKAIVYHPIQRADGSIEWSCSSRGFDPKLLPATCRDLK